MRASAVEFRLRMLIQVVLVVLGFWAPWARSWVPSAEFAPRISLLQWLALNLSRLGIITFSASAVVVIVFAALIAGLGALLRVWGAAYLGTTTIHHDRMQAGELMADGPYRFLRNPLYAGNWCMMAAISLLMPPSGALFTLPLVTIFYLRLIFSEEAFLERRLGDPYRLYLRAVPRLFPRIRSGLPPAGRKPHWLIALLTEINPIGIFAVFACLSWSYDNLLMVKAIVVCFGLSLVVRAFAINKTAHGPAAA
jgi:protein-S-isoprenylcysteine O-methyltransferase Ste14